MGGRISGGGYNKCVGRGGGGTKRNGTDQTNESLGLSKKGPERSRARECLRPRVRRRSKKGPPPPPPHIRKVLRGKTVPFIKGARKWRPRSGPHAFGL